MTPERERALKTFGLIAGSITGDITSGTTLEGPNSPLLWVVRKPSPMGLTINIGWDWIDVTYNGETIRIDPAELFESLKKPVEGAMPPQAG